MKPGCDCDILSVTGSSCHLPSPGWLRPGPGQDYRHPAQVWPGLSSVSSLETAAQPPSLLLQEAGRDRCCSRLAAWTNLDPNTGYNVGPTFYYQSLSWFLITFYLYPGIMNVHSPTQKWFTRKAQMMRDNLKLLPGSSLRTTNHSNLFANLPEN